MSSLVDLLRASAAQFGPLPAIHFQGRTTTHAAFGQATDRFAAGLAARGIAPGDRVGLYCVNSDAFAIAYFGILKAGAMVVPVNLLLNPKEAAYILKDAGVKALVYFEAFAEAVNAIKSQVPSLTLQVCIGAQNPLQDIPFSDLLAASGPVPQPALNPAEDLAAILYTSGTTGHPKGAMLTPRSGFIHVSNLARTLMYALSLDRDVVLEDMNLYAR
jgi:long-chain acyl-CoA synthetase